MEHFRILRPYLRGLPIIVAAMVIGVLVARKYLSYATPIYESTAKLKLADANNGVPNSNLMKDFDVFVSSEKVAAEIELMKSTVLLKRVIDKLAFDLIVYRVGSLRKVELFNQSPIRIQKSGLTEKGYDKEFFINVTDNSRYQLSLENGEVLAKGNFGEVAVTEFGNFIFALNDSMYASKKNLKLNDRYSFVFPSREKAIAETKKNLDVIAVDKDVAVVRISFKHPNPAKAAQFANALAEAYIQDYVESKYQTASVTANFLDGQIGGIMQKLSEAEKNIQDYRDQESITNITQETETDLRKIAQLKIQQTNLKMNLEAIVQLDDYMAAGKDDFLKLAPNFEAFTDLLSTEIIKKIKALQAEKLDLKLTYTDEDERVKVVDQKIEQMTSYLSESVKNTRRSLETKFKNITQDIENAQKVFIDVPEKERLLTTLDREFNIYQQSYNYLNEKRIEAGIAESAKIAFHRIITPAEVSKEPVSPNKTIITIVAALLGMFGAIMFIFVVHQLKAKVNDVENIESNSNIPLAVLTPKLKSQAEYDAHFLKQVIQLQIKGLLKDQSVVAFTSHKLSEGSQFNALGMAKALSLQSKKVLLVDVDGQLAGKPASKLPPVKVVSLAESKYLYYTPDGIAALLDSWRGEYDAIIIANEPLRKNLKSNMLMNAADLNLMCLDARLTPQRRIDEFNVMVEQLGFSQPFFLLNRWQYNPSVVVEAKIGLRKLMDKLKGLRKPSA